MAKTWSNATQRATKGLRTAAAVGAAGAVLTAAVLTSQGSASPDHVPFSVIAPVETRGPEIDSETTVSIGANGELGGGVTRPKETKRCCAATKEARR